MINPPDFRSIKRSVTMESVFRPYQVQLRRSGKDQYRAAARFTVVTGTTPFT